MLIFLNSWLLLWTWDTFSAFYWFFAEIEIFIFNSWHSIMANRICFENCTLISFSNHYFWLCRVFEFWLYQCSLHFNGCGTMYWNICLQKCFLTNTVSFKNSRSLLVIGKSLPNYLNIFFAFIKNFCSIITSSLKFYLWSWRHIETISLQSLLLRGYFYTLFLFKTRLSPEATILYLPGPPQFQSVKVAFLGRSGL